MQLSHKRIFNTNSNAACQGGHPHLHHSFAGDLSRSFQGGLLREESVSVREGVRCRTLYFSDEEKEGEERLCYLDQEKPFDFSKDRTYRITVHGQSIIEIETLDENKAV